MEGYHMPVARASMFPPASQGVIDTFFDAVENGELGSPVVGLRIDFYTTNEDTDHHVTDIALRLYGQYATGENQGAVFEGRTENLPEPSLQAFKDLLYGLHLYGGQIPYSSGFDQVIPWGDPKLKDSFKGAYVSLHATREFTLVSKEYLPSWVSGHKAELIGPAARIEDRRAFCSLVLPPVTTAHEEIEQLARRREISALARALYDHLMHQGMGDGAELALAEIEFDKIENIET